MTTHKQPTHPIPAHTNSQRAALCAISSPTDLAALKAKQKAAWSTGDYAVVGTTVLIVAENLCEAVDLRAGQRVLDVATGHGNAALAAARSRPRSRSAGT